MMDVMDLHVRLVDQVMYHQDVVIVMKAIIEHQMEHVKVSTTCNNSVGSGTMGAVGALAPILGQLWEQCPHTKFNDITIVHNNMAIQ